jgi:hypothetical protein
MKYYYVMAVQLQIDWTIIASIAAVVAAVAAVISIIMEGKRSRFNFGIELLLKLGDRFNSTAMIETRRRAATAILSGSFDNNVNDLLDFIETIGYLLQCGALDKKMVWEEFYYWIFHYWYATRSYIEIERKKTPTQWENIPYLIQSISNIEKEKRGKYSLSEEFIRRFLEEEGGSTPRITIL